MTDWNPLTIYFYDECYARFSAAEYSDSDADLENEHVHLVNNSVAKNSDDFHNRVVAENGEEIKDCMWTMAQMAAYMKFKAFERGIFKGHDAAAAAAATGASGGGVGAAAAATTAAAVDRSQGEDVFETRCRARMREIARCALMSAQGAVEHRKNSWELYGYDYMFDDDFVPWLIEINSSPACDYSTGVTEAFVPRALEDVIKVVVDLREWEAANPRLAARAELANPDRPDTGGWEPIYRGPFLETQRTGLGSDLAIVGTKVGRWARPLLRRTDPWHHCRRDGERKREATSLPALPRPHLVNNLCHNLVLALFWGQLRQIYKGSRAQWGSNGHRLNDRAYDAPVPHEVDLPDEHPTAASSSSQAGTSGTAAPAAARGRAPTQAPKSAAGVKKPAGARHRKVAAQQSSTGSGGGEGSSSDEDGDNEGDDNNDDSDQAGDTEEGEVVMGQRKPKAENRSLGGPPRFTQKHAIRNSPPKPTAQAEIAATTQEQASVEGAVRENTGTPPLTAGQRASKREGTEAMLRRIEKERAAAEQAGPTDSIDFDDI